MLLHLVFSVSLIQLQAASASQTADWEINGVMNELGDRLWDVSIKTCDLKGAGTDAKAFIKVYFETDYAQQTFALDTPGHNDFERDQVDHFKLLLDHTDPINVGLYWWPSVTMGEPWCVEWVALSNRRSDSCFVAVFDKWIQHYRDPPTYPEEFAAENFDICTDIAATHQHRYYLVSDEED